MPMWMPFIFYISSIQYCNTVCNRIHTILSGASYLGRLSLHTHVAQQYGAQAHNELKVANGPPIDENKMFGILMLLYALPGNSNMPLCDSNRQNKIYKYICFPSLASRTKACTRYYCSQCSLGWILFCPCRCRTAYPRPWSACHS